MLSSAKYIEDDFLGTYSSSDKLQSLTLDVHYRKYLGHRLDGFYLSAFARSPLIQGLEDPYSEDGCSFYIKSAETEYLKGSAAKLGFGFCFGFCFGIGYRTIASSGFYWGVSLSVGRYLIGESNKLLNTDGISFEMDDAEFLLNLKRA